VFASTSISNTFAAMTEPSTQNSKCLTLEQFAEYRKLPLKERIDLRRGGIDAWVRQRGGPDQTPGARERAAECGGIITYAQDGRTPDWVHYSPFLVKKQKKKVHLVVPKTHGEWLEYARCNGFDAVDKLSKQLDSQLISDSAQPAASSTLPVVVLYSQQETLQQPDKGEQELQQIERFAHHMAKTLELARKAE
jgi:hypothetical protein